MMQDVAVEDPGPGLLSDEVDGVPLAARNVDRILGEAVPGHDPQGEAVQGMPILPL